MNKVRAIKLKSRSKMAKENLLAENLWSSENLNFVNLNSVNSVNSSSYHKVDSCRLKKNLLMTQSFSLTTTKELNSQGLPQNPACPRYQ